VGFTLLVYKQISSSSDSTTAYHSFPLLPSSTPWMVMNGIQVLSGIEKASKHVTEEMKKIRDQYTNQKKEVMKDFTALKDLQKDLEGFQENLKKLKLSPRTAIVSVCEMLIRRQVERLAVAVLKKMRAATRSEGDSTDLKVDGFLSHFQKGGFTAESDADSADSADFMKELVLTGLRRVIGEALIEIENQKKKKSSSRRNLSSLARKINQSIDSVAKKGAHSLEKQAFKAKLDGLIDYSTKLVDGLDQLVEALKDLEEEWFGPLEEVLFSTCVHDAVSEAVQSQVVNVLGKYASGAREKVDLMRKYEETVLGSLSEAFSFTWKRCAGMPEGLRTWKNLGSKKPTGKKIENKKLEAKLKEKVAEIENEEWVDISLSHLSHNDYIQVDNEYFQPVGKEIRNLTLQTFLHRSEEKKEEVVMIPLKDWNTFGVRNINLLDFVKTGNGSYFHLTGKPNKVFAAGKVRGAVLSSLLKGATKYDSSGYLKMLTMTKLAMQRMPDELIRDEKELQYLLDTIKQLQAGGFTMETWRDSVATWLASLDLYKKIKVERGLAVIECIASDSAVMLALGAAKPLMVMDGTIPPSVLSLLNNGPANHIRDHAFEYIQQLEKELSVIKTIQAYQARMVAVIGAAVTAAFISAGNFAARAAHDTYKEKKPADVGVVIIVLVSIFGLCCCLGSCVLCARQSDRPKPSGYHLV
jgi:hypothetical protein